MRTRMGVTLLTASAAALTIGLSATASSAATATWTVKPGGAITGAASGTVLKDNSTGTKLSCKTSKAKGTAKKGSGLAGAKIAKITSVTFATCTGPAGLTFTVKTTATASKPWFLNAKTYSGGVTHGTLTGIKATLSGTACSATVAGTSASKTGSVKGTYTNSTHVLKVSPTGGTLHIWNVSGCLGLIANGNASGFTGKYKITPAQTITGS